jgi:hypothetical protein
MLTDILLAEISHPNLKTTEQQTKQLLQERNQC